MTAIRELILRYFNADPKLFDVIFVANATAGMKLVADGFSGSPNGFRYKYLRDAHTSLVGISGLAQESECLSEAQVAAWLEGPTLEQDIPGLFAYPAQSNFNGRRFPLGWLKKLRQKFPRWHSLLDAASYLTTTPLDYSDISSAPDFTVLSFYKIFGYPDLGAVIVQKDAGSMLLQRRYFGGGTVATLTADASFITPRDTLHEALEDGTLPFHTILALEASFANYNRLFGPQINVALHAASVCRLAHTLLQSLKHWNGQPVCRIYSALNHGPIVTFNLLSPTGGPVGFTKFEKQSSLRGFALRTGGLCNPGGVQHYLEFPNAEMEQIFRSGKVCGDDTDIVNGKTLGVIRVSFGACSAVDDVYAFVQFVRECYTMKE